MAKLFFLYAFYVISHCAHAVLTSETRRPEAIKNLTDCEGFSSLPEMKTYPLDPKVGTYSCLVRRSSSAIYFLDWGVYASQISKDIEAVKKSFPPVLLRMPHQFFYTRVSPGLSREHHPGWRGEESFVSMNVREIDGPLEDVWAAARLLPGKARDVEVKYHVVHMPFDAAHLYDSLGTVCRLFDQLVKLDGLLFASAPYIYFEGDKDLTPEMHACNVLHVFSQGNFPYLFWPGLDDKRPRILLYRNKKHDMLSFPLSYASPIPFMSPGSLTPSLRAAFRWDPGAQPAAFHPDIYHLLKRPNTIFGSRDLFKLIKKALPFTSSFIDPSSSARCKRSADSPPPQVPDIKDAKKLPHEEDAS